jgi:hypothetical protein
VGLSLAVTFTQMESFQARLEPTQVGLHIPSLGTDTLAYYCLEFISAVKRFITLFLVLTVKIDTINSFINCFRVNLTLSWTVLQLKTFSFTLKRPSLQQKTS